MKKAEKDENRCLRIQDGSFASKWISENKSGGRAKLITTRRKEAEHLLECTGRELRKMMSWLKK